MVKQILECLDQVHFMVVQRQVQTYLRRVKNKSLQMDSNLIISLEAKSREVGPMVITNKLPIQI